MNTQVPCWVPVVLSEARFAPYLADEGRRCRGGRTLRVEP